MFKNPIKNFTMPNAIKEEPTSSPMADESPKMVPKSELDKLKRQLEETVPKKEFNRLKRKLNETEPELRECKRKLDQADLKHRQDQKQLKALKTLITGVQFKPKRANIRMNLPDCAKPLNQMRDKYSFFSEPIEIAGFQWTLRACRNENGTSIGLFLYAHAPAHYRGPFEFELDCTFRLFNTFSNKDIHKKKSFKIVFESHRCGYNGLWDFVDVKTILDVKNGFLQCDGSIQVEADFTVKTATLDHFLVDPAQNGTAGNNAGSSSD